MRREADLGLNLCFSTNQRRGLGQATSAHWQVSSSPRLSGQLGLAGVTWESALGGARPKPTPTLSLSERHGLKKKKQKRTQKQISLAKSAFHLPQKLKKFADLTD